MSEGEIFIHEYGEMDLKDGMVIVGFPSVGLVSSIASNYVVRTMKLERKAPSSPSTSLRYHNP
jgi:uncharacterized protein